MRLTLATWRIAEFGFLGVIVTTLVTIPLACGHFFSMGARPQEGNTYFLPDFLYINLGGIFKTGIFNIADLSVTMGMILILLGTYINSKRQSVEEFQREWWEEWWKR